MKDLLIYLTVIAAIVVIPMELGGYEAIVARIPADRLLLKPPVPGNLGQYSAYVTLALGSALALFLYPHSVTGLLSASSRNVIKRNAALLPTYSIALALLATLGYMAYVSGVQNKPEYAAGFARYGANFAVPALYLDQFPDWFVGVSFAAIAMRQPAAISRSPPRTSSPATCIATVPPSPAAGRDGAKRVASSSSLALAFILCADALSSCAARGVWIIQTLPAVVTGCSPAGFTAAP